MNVFERFREAWMVFRGRDHPRIGNQYPWPGAGWYTGPSSSDRPDRLRLRPGNERTLVNSVYNRISLDCASVEVHHAKVDENDGFQEVIHDELEDLFTVEANTDQTSMSYMIDLVMSMLDEGVVAEVPIDFDDSGGIPSKITQMRIGRIVEWKPQEITVECYDERTGQKERIPMSKRECCIHENPFYSVMNEKNSIFQRLVRKLNVLDVIDSNLGSNQMNIIMQLPYIIRSEGKKQEAKNRIKEVEAMLTESPHGIAYVDGTEKIIQLNRPVENNLQSQVEWLTTLFFSQLGVTQEILNGTADEKTMANYMNRCIGAIMQSVCLERKRKLLTRDQRINGESIVFVQDPLKMVPVTLIADIFDKLTRNAILAPNECRGVLGYKPSDDPSANELVNRNMPVSETPGGEVQPTKLQKEGIRNDETEA